MCRGVVCGVLVQLCERTERQYDKLFNRGAFLDVYRKESIFSDSLEEFESAREVVDQLIKEYNAATQADYITWPASAPGGPSGTGAPGGPSGSGPSAYASGAPASFAPMGASGAF